MKILFAAAVAAVGFGAMAQGPTMGWSSWNTYRVNISDSLIKSQADALVALGLDTLGFNYINIDDGYFGPRNSCGRLTFNQLRFPGGMKPVADYIHELGLKAGIYSDAGRSTCGSFWDNDSAGRGVGLYGHDREDCHVFFDSLAFDFIKVDFCGGDPRQNADSLDLDERERYTQIAAAIAETGREVRLNVCRWAFPGTWVTPIAGSWRISPDINASWNSVRSIINRNMHLSAYSSPGHYNDMDMLEIGRGMTTEEDRTHFAMWCMMGSPLMIGCDLTTITPEALALLRNRQLVELCRDTAETQAYPLSIDADGRAILVRDIGEAFGLTRAVAFYNPTNEPTRMTVGLIDLNLAGQASAADLTMQLPAVAVSDSIVVDVPAHGCRIYRVEGKERLHRAIYPAADAWLSAFQEIDPEKPSPRVVRNQPTSDNPTRTVVEGVGGSTDNRIEWRKVHIAKPGDYLLTVASLTPISPSAVLTVDGQTVSLKNSKAIVALSSGTHVVALSDAEAPLPPLSHLAVDNF